MATHSTLRDEHESIRNPHTQLFGLETHVKSAIDILYHQLLLSTKYFD